MKTLLVNPPIPNNFYNREFYLPSGLLYLGAVLQEKGDDVKLIDFKPIQRKNPNLSQKSYGIHLEEIVSNYKPDLIGFGGLFSGNFLDVLELSQVVKRKFPEIPTIMGGVHPSMYAHDILANCPSLDWLVLGEGEDTIVKLSNMMKERNYNLGKLDGFAFRENEKIIINPKKKYIQDLDSIPFPAYNLIDLEDYYEDTTNWHNPKGLQINTEIPIISSRSCPYKCNFCASSEIMGRGWRARSATNVVDEIQLLYEMGQTHFSFMDDNFTFNKSRLLDICDQIDKRGLNIQFETHNGVSIRTLDDEAIDAMASAGLTRIALPIESGSDYMRNKIMRKKLDKEKIFEVVDSLKKYKQIYTRAFFIIGMPEETHETLNDTYKMIQRINVDKVHLTNIVPFPGTDVFKQAMRDNIIVNVDTNNLYRSDQLYQTNIGHFSIKPYDLELSDLHEFRAKCDKMIQGLKK